MNLSTVRLKWFPKVGQVGSLTWLRPMGSGWACPNFSDTEVDPALRLQGRQPVGRDRLGVLAVGRRDPELGSLPGPEPFWRSRRAIRLRLARRPS